MKSIKPGRGPSFKGGIISILMALFGFLWTIVAAGIGGGFFALFGVIFIIVAVVEAVYNFKNATGKNRYSDYDITEHGEEPDPLNERFGAVTNTVSNEEPKAQNKDGETRYCPYCGTKAEKDYSFCKSCGKKLP